MLAAVVTSPAVVDTAADTGNFNRNSNWRAAASAAVLLFRTLILELYENVLH
jgi:hypothetical protein